jgi:hypothetical protein
MRALTYILKAPTHTGGGCRVRVVLAMELARLSNRHLADGSYFSTER